MAVAFGRRIDVQRENQNELANAALKAAEMKRDRVMVACIHLLSKWKMICQTRQLVSKTSTVSIV